MILLLILFLLASSSPSMTLGFNWIGNYAVPAGETPQSALARIGGSMYREYGDPFQGATDRSRMRLVRYGDTFQTPNALPGATWQLGNEINLAEQSGRRGARVLVAEYADWGDLVRKIYIFPIVRG